MPAPHREPLRTSPLCLHNNPTCILSLSSPWNSKWLCSQQSPSGWTPESWYPWTWETNMLLQKECLIPEILPQPPTTWQVQRCKNIRGRSFLIWKRRREPDLLRFERQSEKLRCWFELGKHPGKFRDSLSKPAGVSKDEVIFSCGSLWSPEVVWLTWI